MCSYFKHFNVVLEYSQLQKAYNLAVYGFENVLHGAAGSSQGGDVRGKEIIHSKVENSPQNL